MEKQNIAPPSSEDALSRLKTAYKAGVTATLASISIGFLFKIWLLSGLIKTI